MAGQNQLLSSLGVNLAEKNKMPYENWLCYSLNHNNPTKDIPIILVERGPKNASEVKKFLKKFDICIVVWAERNMLFLKALCYSHSTVFENDAEYEKISSILTSCNIADATSELKMSLAITNAIKAIPSTTSDFDNRGIFSTHYLRNRIFQDIDIDMDAKISGIKQKIGQSPDKLLTALGWDISNPDGTYYDGKVSVVITAEDDFSIRKKDSDVAPSYTAISKLRDSKWVILTNGTKWRLYTNRISASSTNYFEITLNPQRDSITRYLIAIFQTVAFEEKDGVADIDLFFDEGRNYATSLEDDLSARIMSPNGLFLHIVKGVLDHYMKKTFSTDELEDAKQTALKIMYRIWFLAYAESRDLLPTRDEKYKPISLQSIRNRLDSYDADPKGEQCWSDLLRLFEGVRSGSVEHNLPQYSGDLFKHTTSIDDISIKNHFIVSALFGLLEKNGEAIDYASLSVRHLGNIFETLMEFGVRQAKSNIMLIEEKNGVKEVKTKQESTYSYQKNDLYLASKGGIALRKMSASFYTPDKLVEFLVRQGLQPIFDEREKLIKNDLKKYKNHKSDKNRSICMDRLLDIQVLDPAMGSGHFLVEALNKITTWVTSILKTHPEHPLLEEIEQDRITIISEQRKNGIIIDENLLTHDVLLKRKIMKRCIFGVDLNPLAVELTKLSLWLDSFAIGVPLTYMDHHVKIGDSTIGVMLDELKDPENQTLDSWLKNPESTSKIIEDVTFNSDITIKQVQNSKNQHAKYVKEIKPYKIMLDALTTIKIDKKFLPTKNKNSMTYVIQLANVASGKLKNHDKDLKKRLKFVIEQSNAYKFFHWELEMMDAFTDKRRGFDLIVGNPPWDKIRPNAKEFFENIDPTYKEKSDKEKKKIQNKYEKEYNDYEKIFVDKRTFYKNHGGIGENTDFDLYRLIVERMFQILAPNGVFSMLMPSAILNSRGATALRKHILTKHILSLHVFENKKRIFPIHTAYRFALLSVQNANGPDIFPSGFYLHTLNELENMGEKLLYLSKKQIEKLSPQISLIYEVRTQKDYQIIQKLLSTHPKLEDVRTWSVDLGRELNMGEQKDKKLLVKHNGWPILESKNFHQHIHAYSHPQYYGDITKTLTRTKTIAKFYNLTDKIHENPRLVYRAVSSSTNTRTMIACIIPKSTFTTIATYMAIPRIGSFDIDNDYHRLNAYLCGVFNSTTYDYIMRSKIDKNVETYHLYDTPVPENFINTLAEKISKLSTILTLSETWHDDMATVFSITKKDANDNTLGRRIEIVAEIDALVAIQYGLTRDEYSHILTTFKSDYKSFTKEELSNNVEYKKLAGSDRNKHMRKFYGEIYRRVLTYYDNVIKNTTVIEKNMMRQEK